VRYIGRTKVLHYIILKPPFLKGATGDFNFSFPHLPSVILARAGIQTSHCIKMFEVIYENVYGYQKRDIIRKVVI
jgi:hypothetical protein